MQYSQKVMDHFMNPRNVGKVDKPSGVGEVGNPTCGDIMHIEIEVADDVIKDIKFRTFGCAAAIATSSMVTEMVKGKTLEEAERITNRTVAEALDGLPPVKMHCSNLAADALHEAIKSYRQGGESSATVTKGCCQNEADSTCEKGMEIILPQK